MRPEETEPNHQEPQAAEEGNASSLAPFDDPDRTQQDESGEKQRYPATFGLIGLILAAYGMTTYPTWAGPSKEMMMLGAFYPPLVAAGEYWRFITATLMHGNINHLFNNVFGILIFGQMLEPVLGSGRLVGLYIVSGLLGLIFSFFLLPQSVTIGASAIDYGLIGAYFAIILLVRYHSDRAVFHQELRSTVIFVILFVSWNTLQLQQVNLWAHLGGFIGGLLFAWRIWSHRRPSP